MSRRQREVAWKRERILEAAASVFVRRGFHGATMDEIAREADYSTPSLYNYFPGKEEIFQGVIAATSLSFLDCLREPTSPALPFPARLVTVLQRLFRLAEKRRDLFVAFVAQRGFFEWDLRADLGQEAHDAYLASIDAFADVIQTGVDEGVLRPGHSATDYAFALVGLTNAFIFRWLLAESGPSLPDEAERIAELFLHGASSR